MKLSYSKFVAITANSYIERSGTITHPLSSSEYSFYLAKSSIPWPFASFDSFTVLSRHSKLCVYLVIERKRDVSHSHK